jgi:hypothetical protein
MSEAAIFTYGLVVFGIVSAACWMIIWGIVQERRDREGGLDAGPDARSSAGEPTKTEASGKTIPTAPAGQG